MTRVLLLTSARTGAGHRAVAEALAQGAKDRAEALTITVLDVLAPAQPRWTDRLAHLYEPIIVHAPWLWRSVFRLTNGPLGVALYRGLTGQSLARRVVAAAEAQVPEVLVSVHPLLGYTAVHARSLSPLLARVPIVAVVTDLVDVHRLWVVAGTDYYVVGTEAAAAALMAHGVSPPQLARLGLPLRPSFGRLDVPAREMRQYLDLDPDLPAVLMMGGGTGAGDLVARVRAVADLARRGRQFQLVVVTGGNVRARLALEGVPWPLPVRVYGRTEQVAELMTAADVIATKPGSVTLCEAAALGRPLILSRPVGGQEDGNVPYVVRSQAGFYAPSHQEAADAIDLLLREPATRWEMGQRAARLGRPDATRRTLDLIQSVASRQ